MRTHDKLIESGLYLLIIFTPLAYGSVQPWGVSVFEVTSALIFMLLIMKMSADGRLEFVRNPLMPLIFLFIFYIVLQLSVPGLLSGPCSMKTGSSGLWSEVCGLKSVYARATKTELLKLISYALIFVVTLNAVKTQKQINRILYLITAIGFLMSIFYVMRYFGAGSPRGFINPDHFSAYLGMIIPLALGLLFARLQTSDFKFKSEPRDTRYSKNLMLFFLIVLMSAALFLTMSRGGMFSFIASLLFMACFLFDRKSLRRKVWLLAAVVIFIILAVAWLGAKPVADRIMSLHAEVASPDFGDRVLIWKSSLEIVRDYPVFGSGSGTFSSIFPKYEPVYFSYSYFHAHNDFLELLADNGIPFFLLFLFFSVRCVIGFFRGARRTEDVYSTSLAAGFLGSLAGILIHSFADFNLRIPANAILLSITTALFIATLRLTYLPLTGEYRPDTSNSLLLKISRQGKFVLYTVVVSALILYIVSSIRPALADHYYRKTLVENLLSTTDHETLLKKALSLDPTNADYYYKLGSFYAKQHKADSSQLTIDTYKKAIELNPADSKYHQSLAWTYGRLAATGPGASSNHNIVLAHKEFRLAIHWHPNNPYRHRAYAVWLLNQSSQTDIEKGFSEYRRAVEIEPDLFLEAVNQYYALTGDYNSLEKIIPDNPDTYLLLAGVLFKEGLKRDSTGRAGESVQLKKRSADLLRISVNSGGLKRNVDSLRKLAEVYRSAGKTDEAIREYQTLLNIDTQNRESYLINMGRLYKSLGKDDESRAIWESILSLKDPSPHAVNLAEKELRKFNMKR